ncbi:hypothetical protein K1719_044296 [Acacia pycnantha]|nr:hypothetical protein K1719_044296 [Acacia pycnantha]
MGNYTKTPNEIKLDEAAVLHYTYPKLFYLTSRRDRCGCKPTKKGVKKCSGEFFLSGAKNKELSLSSGDFPTLGFEKDKSLKNFELHDHSSHG